MVSEIHAGFSSKKRKSFDTVPGTYRYLKLRCQKLMDVIGLSRKNCNIRYISKTYTCIYHDIETFRCDDGEGNENVKTKNRLDKKNNNFTRATHFFVHFYDVAARLRRENA